MKLGERIQLTQRLAMSLSALPTRNAAGFELIRKTALDLKKEAQRVASAARAAARRICDHSNLDAGHRSIKEHVGEFRLVRRHFNCVDCGKQNVKEEILEQTGENILAR